MLTGKEMYDYHTQANRKIITRLKELPKNVYQKEIQSVFPRISTALVHLYFAYVLWLETMSGIGMKEAFPSIEE